MGWRWIICLLLFSATVINYMDRQILGLLKPLLAKDLGWSEADYGFIVAAFQAAYAFGQPIFGRVVDILGTRKGYSLAILGWSVAAIGHAFCSTIAGFTVGRVFLGIFEAGNYPAAIKSVAEWFPRAERALATGFFNSGSNFGAILVPAIVPWLTGVLGWRGSFIVLGGAGFVWLIFWLMFFETPAKSRHLSQSERDYIRQDEDDSTQPASQIKWRALLGYRETWACMAISICTSPAWWFYLFWLPPFFSSQFGLDLKGMSLPLVFIYSVTCLGSIGGGWLSSWLISRGWSVNWARKSTALLCAFGTVPILFTTLSHQMWVAAGLFALAAASHQGWAATTYTVISDLFPKSAVASVVGLCGMAGALAATLFAVLVGLVLEHMKTYAPILIFCGGAYIIAWLVLHILVPKIRPISMS